MYCPRCGSHKIQNSRTRFKWQVWRRQLTGKRPYRCDNCGKRGWALDSGPRFSAAAVEASSRAMASDPPNLNEAARAHDERPALNLDLSRLDSAISAKSAEVEKF